MSSSSAPIQVVRFGVFEADLRSRELRKSGIRIKLHDQPFQILAMLLERPGELVTREEIRKKLWPGETFVDFDHSLNNAVNRLRDGLGDSADSPRFIETLPRRGYRFIGTVYRIEPGAISVESAVASAQAREAGSVEVKVEVPVREPRRPSHAWMAVVGAAVLLAALALMKVRIASSTQPVPIRSLAVLPLENLSGDPTQQYFADGMTEALITELARIGSLRVISRTSVMTYKTERKPLTEIARELRVDAVIEGSVVRFGDRVRVNAQLIQASPEHNLWANAYERDASDIIALQSDLARAITNEIQVRLTPQEKAHLSASRVVDPDAYNAYLLGQYFLDRAGKDNLEMAVSYYQQAIKFDSKYAPAWAGLADAHRYLGGGGHVSAEEAEKNSRLEVERAIELDPNLAEAHAVLGSIETFVDWDWTAARVSFDRALALQPGNISALRGAALLAAISGHFEDAMELAHRAVERDPLNPRSYRLLGSIAVPGGRTDEAMRALQRSIQLNPDGIFAHTDLAWIYLAQSRSREALTEVEHETAQERSLLGLAVANHALGRKKESDAALIELIKRHGSDAGFQVAQAFAYRGEPDQAFKWLERAYRQRDGALVSVGYDPLLKSLHRDPRYTAFLNKMRLPT